MQGLLEKQMERHTLVEVLENGVVNKGQTSCYTPMVYDLDPRKAQAQGNMQYQIVMLIIMRRLFGIDEIWRLR